MRINSLNNGVKRRNLSELWEDWCEKPYLGYLIGLLLLVLIGIGVNAAWQSALFTQSYDYKGMVQGDWNGEMNGMPTTLSLDTMAQDSVRGTIYVKSKKGLLSHKVSGFLSHKNEGCYVLLEDLEASSGDALNGNYRLFLAEEGHLLKGNYIDYFSGITHVIALQNGKGKPGSKLCGHVRNGANVRQFIVEPLFADSVKCYPVTFKDTCWVEKKKTRALNLAKGELIDSCGRYSSETYVVFAHDGKHYRIQQSSLLWSETNPEHVTNSLHNAVVRYHTDWGRFLTTLWPCWLVIGFIVLAILICYISVWFDIKPLRQAGIIVVPLLLLAVAGIEVMAYQLFGGDAFWWCDVDRYGFWRSALRILPFILVVFAQIASIWWYEAILFYDEPGRSKEIHLKPAVIGFLVSIPAVIVFYLVAQMGFKWKGSGCELTAGLLFLGIILVGVGITLKQNIGELGFWKGIAITLFALVYILGTIVAVGALVVAILQLIFQILCVLFGLAILCGAGAGAGKTIYQDRSGNLYEKDSFGNLIKLKKY